MKLKNVLVVYYVHNYNSLKEIESCLKRNKIMYKAVKRDYLGKALLKNKDLVISVGGDGTFLKVARLAGSIPVLSVSSEKRYNEGFFARAEAKDFGKKLKLILKGKHKIIELARLEGKFRRSNEKILAVNEIFVGSGQPQHTSRYILQVGGKKEFHKSSGVLVSTPAGSHAWAKSAGAGQLPLTSKKFLYLVREPYIGRLTKSKLTYGVLGEKQKVRIVSQIHNGIAVADSSQKSHKFRDGEIIEIKKSRHSLRMVDF